MAKIFHFTFRFLEIAEVILDDCVFRNVVFIQKKAEERVYFIFMTFQNAHTEKNGRRGVCGGRKERTRRRNIACVRGMLRDDGCCDIFVIRFTGNQAVSTIKFFGY